MAVRLIHFIAGRYLLSRKSHSVVNIISIVSAVAVAIPTAAMIVLLSVHNGLNDFIVSLNSRFDADLKVSPREGRYFSLDSLELSGVAGNGNVAAWSFIVEDNALFSYKDRQHIGSVRGVDSLYGEVVPIREVVTNGLYPDSGGALLGMGVAYQLAVTPAVSGDISLFVPSGGGGGFLTPGDFYNRIDLPPVGIFTLDVQTDSRYVIIPLADAWRLYNRSGEATALAVKLKDPSRAVQTKREIAQAVGASFLVQTQLEQQEAQYKILRQEKLAIYLILVLVLVIASFTLIGAVVMLIVEKSRESETLQVLGMTTQQIRQVFIRQGLYISLSGIVLGLLLGLSLSYAQQQWGFITLGGGSLLEAYPVRVSLPDVAGVVISVVAVNVIISVVTVSRMIRK